MARLQPEVDMCRYLRHRGFCDVSIPVLISRKLQFMLQFMYIAATDGQLMPFESRWDEGETFNRAWPHRGRPRHAYFVDLTRLHVLETIPACSPSKSHRTTHWGAVGGAPGDNHQSSTT